MIHLSRLHVFALLLFLLATGCRPNANPAPAPNAASQSTPVTLALNWFPEAEHGGFYAAQAAGYFEEARLDVRIIPGGPNVPVIQNVARGEAMFGVGTADQVLLGRAAEADVVALLAPLQNSPRCILVHEESGITKLDELKDITLAMRTGIAFSEFLKSKVPLENVKIVPYTGNVSQFLLDKRYAQQAYIFSEPFVAEQQGAKTRSLLVSELGYNPYTSLLFTSGSLIKTNPQLVEKMTRACQRGWQKYLEDSAAANDAIHAANPEMSLAALEYGAKAIKPLCLPTGTSSETLGQMTRERWQTLADQLIEIKLLEPGKVKVEEAFDSQFSSSLAQ